VQPGSGVAHKRPWAASATRPAQPVDYPERYPAGIRLLVENQRVDRAIFGRTACGVCRRVASIASLTLFSQLTSRCPKSHPPESNRRPTDYERTQEVAGRFRRVLVSRKIEGLRVNARPSAGTGRHGHGDWIETDRLLEGSDLLIPRAVRVQATLMASGVCDWPASSGSRWR
jgi:hypothetical protein